MSKKPKFLDIYNYRLKELADNLDPKTVHAGGSARALVILIPYIAIISFFEYIWKRIFLKK